jgi:hypothetical protein
MTELTSHQLDVPGATLHAILAAHAGLRDG